ncbi:tetratricopeptide repeat protein [Thalassotalea crassostreae]|uniref:tetratricopeptide repeat protein n=1 Tax=Thalassotalea crassostreae TaxID=1763536 RepID=UPI000838D8F9|nr:tetratricopeptide repeat protein [Thalassotalea crassostreae]
MKIYLMLSVVMFTAISGCSSTPEQTVKTDNELLYIDNAFAQYQTFDVPTEEEIFALDESMKDFVTNSLIVEEDPNIRATLLLNKLFSRTTYNLQYRYGANLTASQAFKQYEANCLSLTILAYALAREANLQVRFQEILIPEYWVREGGYNMLTRHVNLKVIGDSKTPYRVLVGQKETIIDFDPYTTKKHFRKKIIARDRVVAMFYNNIGAQALANGQYDEAYAYFKASLLKDDEYSAAWSNLGYLYKSVGLDKVAEQAYLSAVNYNHNNFNAWSNLEILVKSQGRIEESDSIKKFLYSHRVRNPYYHALLGEEAYFNGNYKQSIKHYNKAKRIEPEEHEFYFGLSRSFYMLGEYDKAESNLAKAQNKANFKDIKEKYRSKLNLLSKL